MSDERLARIEGTLGVLVKGQAELIGRVTNVETGQAELIGRVTNVETGQAELIGRVTNVETGQAELKSSVVELKGSVVELRGSVAELRTHMGVLHEDVIGRIRDMAEDASLRTEMNRRFDEVMTNLADHAIPGDAADRHFARAVNDHEKRITALEESERSG